MLRQQGEVVRLPPRGEGNAHAPIREVVDEAPLLSDSDRVVEWKHAAPGPDLHASRQGRDRSACHGGVGVETPERMKVSLRRPDGGKPVLVSKLCALGEQAILLG